MLYGTITLDLYSTLSIFPTYSTNLLSYWFGIPEEEKGNSSYKKNNR